MYNNIQKRPFRKTKIGKISKRFERRALQLNKLIYQKIHRFSHSSRRNVFIFGCQRSGTTLLGLVFNRDLRSAVLQEINCLTGSNEGQLRLKPYSDVRKNLDKIKAPLIVVKPLVESHRAGEILEEVPQSKGIWMFRHYKDVVASNTKRFSSQVQGLKMAITGDPPSWRSEGISNETRTILKKFYHEDMSAADAAALGWYSINTLFFQMQLNDNPGILLCKYEEFCQDPENILKKLYAFIDMLYPKWNLKGEVDMKSLSLGRDIDINDKIEALCIDLQNRMDNEYYKVKAIKDSQN